MGFRSSSVSGGGITGFFGDRAFARSLMHIALPVTLQSMLRASFSIIDQVMIGQLGSASISGIGLGGKFASIHNVVLSAVTAAGAILISQYLGQGSRKNAARSYSVNLLVSLAIAAVFTLVSTRFAEPILGLYTQDDATRALGQTYLQTYAWSFFPAALSGMAETLLCCMEAAVFPLIASMTSLCINTGLNYLLIFGHGGLPALGVQGAAVASVAAQVVSCLLVYLFLAVRLRKKQWRLRFTLGFTRPELLTYAKILLPLLASEFLWSLGENVYSAIYGNIGTQACAAMTMTTPIQCLMVGALSGLSKAAAILIGKSLGTQEYERAYRDAQRLMRCGLAASLVLSALLLVFGRLYTTIYRVEPEVRATAYLLLVVFAVISPVKVQNMILGGGILKSGGKTNYTLAIDLIGTWGFGVPLGFLAAFVLKLPVAPVYFLLSLEECVRLALSLRLFKKRSWMQQL